MSEQKLFMAILGCRPGNRLTEQHDIFFGIGTTVKDLVPAIYAAWPEAKKNIHLDAWREVTQVDGFSISIVPRDAMPAAENAASLFFINLGGYKAGEFDEFHYKMLIAAADKPEAVAKAKKTAFFKHMGFKGATAHIDDRYGVDVDDFHEIKEILPAAVKEQYRIVIQPAAGNHTDEIHLGYFPAEKL